jgi:hypothetical protein
MLSMTLILDHIGTLVIVTEVPSLSMIDVQMLVLFQKLMSTPLEWYQWEIRFLTAYQA